MTGTITKQGPRTSHLNVINRINNTRVSLFKQTFKRTGTKHSVDTRGYIPKNAA